MTRRLMGHPTRYEFLDARLLTGSSQDAADLQDQLEQETGRYRTDAVMVEWRGGDTWVVKHGDWQPGKVWCEVYGKWEYEPSPSNRSDDFIKRTRYDKLTAMKIAERLANADQEDS